ncbi:MAG TPA: hypothetical protein H9837_03095 [Candidatus Brachybacterium merdigallinarum]|nr:hypothetical protein [Candidatus Brachybacterium merdigallinarum]
MTSTPVPATSRPPRDRAPQRSLNWALIIGLGAAALARPTTNMLTDQLGIELGPIVPLGWTLVISLVWILVVGLGRTARPLLTLTLTGVFYALFAIVLSAVASTILLGALSGPLAQPLAILPMLLLNALWGLLCGALALALRHARGRADGDPRREGTGRIV